MASRWKGKTVLITSGPTREFLDPVRFMTNASSGKMGYALAAAAMKLGAKAVVVTGPTTEPAPRGATIVAVVTALEMRRAVRRLQKKADVVIGAAAVSDWRFAGASSKKIKRKPGALRLTLLPNPDIIKDAARRRKKGQLIVGFALETHAQLAYAEEKLAKKGLDAVVANGTSSLAADRAAVVVLRRDGTRTKLGPASKKKLAVKILRTLL